LLVRGISTRNYDAALTSLSDGLGLKRSAVSSAFQRASQKDLDALNGRRLGEWTFVAVYLDGVGFADHTCIVAMGVTTDGQKRILGLREGATENAAVVGDLLEELVERGLQLCPRTLFVLDGSKALRRGVENVFGKRAVVQRRDRAIDIDDRALEEGALVLLPDAYASGVDRLRQRVDRSATEPSQKVARCRRVWDANSAECVSR
ncbi:MAG: hypothetical protein GY722_29235, partial [bacterium]|nr:hypothetical protein [bacterium]